MKPKYEHIIWDWNGTLLNDAWLCIVIISGMLVKRGKPAIDETIYLKNFTFPVADFYKIIGFDFSSEPFSVPADEYIKEYDNRRYECRLREGISDILASIKNAGIPQSVLSASKQQSLEEIISHYELTRYFKNICGIDDHYANGKIEKGRELVKKIGQDFEKIVIIGDTVHDFEVAREIGIDCILISGGHQNIKRLNSCGGIVLDNISELKKYLF